MNRNLVFDYACGLAIIALVMGNSAPMLDPALNLSFFFRLVASFPAPILIAAACATVASADKSHGFTYFVQRGIFFILLGAAMDVIANKILPFQGFDILYCVGILLPLSYLINKLESVELFAITGLIFAASALLQQILGYQEEPMMMGLKGEIDPNLASVVIWKHWVIDGWYPIFPWVGIGFSGILFNRYYESHKSTFTTISFISIMVALIISGIAVGYANPNLYYTRHGYIELFYPPTLSFIFTALGTIGLTLCACEHMKGVKNTRPLSIFGKMPLTIYVFHLLIISNILAPFFFPIQDYISFYAIFIPHIGLLYICALFINHVRENHQQMPVMLKWLFGR